MLIIKREQLQLFDAVAERDFHNRLLSFLREELPEYTADMDDTGLRLFIREAQSHAERHGIESDQGIAQYVCLALETSPTFADAPEISSYLHQPGVSPDLGMDELVELLGEMPED